VASPANHRISPRTSRPHVSRAIWCVVLETALVGPLPRYNHLMWQRPQQHPMAAGASPHIQCFTTTLIRYLQFWKPEVHRENCELNSRVGRDGSFPRVQGTVRSRPPLCQEAPTFLGFWPRRSDSSVHHSGLSLTLIFLPPSTMYPYDPMAPG
jgi:hypothetical protein